MKLWKIFRFEFAYQAGRVRTWLYFAVLFVIAYLLIRQGFLNDARNGGAPVNSPHVIAFVTGICNVLWMLLATAVAGGAAARDAETRMHPLVYTTPVSTTEYLGGRFLAALALNALILLAVPAGILLALSVPPVETEVLVPSRPAAYLSAYFVIALSTACAATAIQFAWSALTRRSVTAYLGGVLLFVLGFGTTALANLCRLWTVGELLEPSHFFVIGLLSRTWTPLEKKTRLVGLEPRMLANALLWVGIAVGVLVITRLLFRFDHPAGKRRRDTEPVAGLDRHQPARTGRTSAFVVRQAFGFATRARQTLAIAWMSFRSIAKSAAGLVLLAPIAILVGVLMPEFMNLEGVRIVPRTAQIVAFLTHPVAGNPQFPWVLVPLLIVFHAGELIWRERDAGLNEMADATPVPEWVFVLGKFLGLSLVLVVGMAVLTAAGILGQARMGYFDFEIGLYLRTLFGIQFVEYLLFAALVFAIHAVVNKKQVGHLVAVVAYGFIAFASTFGVEHKLLVYASAPRWKYTDMRGFGASLGPWLWFKLYWTSWAMLLAVVATLLWMRGTERSVRMRLQSARRRFTRAAAALAGTAVVLILSVGGFIFYNTNVRHAYVTERDRIKLSAEYEKRYGLYAHIPQPRLTATSLRVEIYPERREAQIHGTYRLVNDGAAAIDSIHLAVAPQVETRAVSFDRRIARSREDDELRYRIYALDEPLRPGEAVQLSFEVDFKPEGFRNRGAEPSVVGNGTYFARSSWLPAIGYQSNRELEAAGVRRQFGLPPRPALRSLDDAPARRIRLGGDPIDFEAIVGTSSEQTAVAPGTLRRTWTEGSRRYFHYVSDVPMDNRYSVFSAAYTLHEEQWHSPARDARSGQGIAIQIFHHPAHTQALGRMMAGVRAALDQYTRQFGPYPYRYLRLIESPALRGVQTEAATIQYGEEFSLLDAGGGPQSVDIVFAVVAHGVARGWWGMQVAPADVEGAGLLEVGLETYSGMRVVEETLGVEHLRRYLHSMRLTPRPRAAPSLLRATGSFAFSRQGPLALYAMHEYIGKERIDEALRHLFEKHRSGTPPLPTSMDLYRELQAVTPEAFQPLLQDLFEKNTFWQLETIGSTAEETGAGAWQVSLVVRARKVVIDQVGGETEVPMNDWIEVGVFGETSGSLTQRHRVHSGAQTITLLVPWKPDRAGIDPRHLLSELGEVDNNVKAVKINLRPPSK